MTAFLQPVSFFLLSAAAGLAFSVLFYRLLHRQQGNYDLAKKVADLLWILIGGVGAGTAILFASYSVDASSLEREKERTLISANEAIDTALTFLEANCHHNYGNMALKPIANDVNALALCLEVRQRFESTLTNNALSVNGGGASRYSRLSESTAEICTTLHGLFDWTECTRYNVVADYLSRKALNTLTALPAEEAAKRALAGDYFFDLRAYEIVLARIEALEEQLDSQVRLAKSLEQDEMIVTVRNAAILAFAFVFPFRIMKSVVDFL